MLIINYFKKTLFLKQCILCISFSFAGAWLHHKEWQNYHHFYECISNEKFTASGTIIDCYQVTINNKKRSAIILSLDTIATKNSTFKSNKYLILYTKSNKNIIVGDIVTFHHIECKKPSNRDFQKYQIKEQIIATIFTRNLNFTINNHPICSLRNWIWIQKNRLLTSLEHKLSSNCFRFFSSLFLGNRTYIKKDLEETNEQFKKWGISHFLARSGLHLVLFIFVWQAFFCAIPLPFFLKQFIVLIISCIYFILSWTSAPFTRAFALFILNKICLFGRIPFHLLHYLTLIFLLFLLYCPLYLFFLDFQLSFALTFALVWLNQVNIQHRTR